jgi:hypothetical protein
MTNEMPKRLPTVRHNGEKYFIDWRLQEFRPVDRPFESIPFDSELGREIDEMPEPQMNANPIENNVTVTCSSCGKLLFAGSENEARHLIIYCEDCLR